MIVTRTPLRISLGGGGTDLPNFAARHGGELLSAAIDAYVYVVVRRGRLDGGLRYSYDTTQTVADVDALDEPLVRACLRDRGLDRECEIVSLGGVPAGSGLGSSGAFTVGLLHALDVLGGRQVDRTTLAEDAWRLEHDVIGRPVGKHDHYITGLGGIRTLCINGHGAVETEPLRLPDKTVRRLQDDLLLFFTGQTRDSRELLARQDATRPSDEAKIHYLHEVKSIGRAIADALRRSDLAEFGRLLHEHWQAKSRSTNGVSNRRLDEVYRIARSCGALGGKLLGAGGGGFFLFYAPEPCRTQVAAAVHERGLRQLPFRFASDGTTALLHEPTGDPRS